MKAAKTLGPGITSAGSPRLPVLVLGSSPGTAGLSMFICGLATFTNFVEKELFCSENAP
jgi:hypothetical protein